MVSMLISEFKSKIAAAFKGKLNTGTIRRETMASLDEFGDPTSPTVTTSYFEGIREDWSARYKMQAGIPMEDVSILIILGLTNPPIIPKQDDKIYLNEPWNQWYQVRAVRTVDPAGAHAVCQAYEIPAPP